MFVVLQSLRSANKARLRAMAAGVAALGGRVVDVPEHVDVDTMKRLIEEHKPHFAITGGMHHHEAVFRGCLAGYSIPLLVLDCGYFQRAGGPEDETGYNQLGLGGLNWVPEIEAPSDRFDAHRLALTERVQGRGKFALLLGQVPGDSQHHLSEIRLNAWLAERGAELMACGYKLFYRPHPKHTISSGPLRAHTIVVRPQDESLAQSLSRVSVVVTYNSTAGIEALMAGIPVVCSPTAHYWLVCGLQSNEALLRHLHRLAWTQWTCAELRTGEPIRWMNRFARLLPS